MLWESHRRAAEYEICNSFRSPDLRSISRPKEQVSSVLAHTLRFSACRMRTAASSQQNSKYRILQREEQVAMTSRKDRMKLHLRDKVTVMDLGEMDIWDGADLSLLRETLTSLIEVEKCRRIGVEMQHVKYIPSGFFGMLFDCHEKGVEISLYSPLPHVVNMLWFRQFFNHVADSCFVLREEPREEFVPVIHENWKNQTPWNESTNLKNGQKSPNSVSAISREN